MKLNVIFLGRCDYKRALDMQQYILDKRQQGKTEDTLILVEHPPVITIGRQGKETNIVVTGEDLKNMGIDVYKTNRGGDVTYHGYGQVVGYPIISLKDNHLGIKKFVENLEEIFIALLRDKYDIEAGRHSEHTGVWVGNDKITAIGLAVKRNITMHGFSLNVNTNLEHFKLIIPCGISDKGVTSVEKLTGKKADIYDINRSVLEYYCKVFRYEGYVECEIDNV
jgi:lipoyl(octanoyl) transferase